MKTKNSYFLLMVCALFTMPFTSCSDKDDELLTPANAVSNLSFVDEDEEAGKIGGTLTWKLPFVEMNIDEYVICLSATATERGAQIGTASHGTVTFTIPNGTAFNNYLIVIAKNAAGESTNWANIAVTDKTPEVPEPHTPETVGLLILNRGNWQANDASLGFYNFASKVVIPDIYKIVNGSGLGDSAEDFLIYGSKVYVAITGSNRLVVLDQTGALIKSFEPIKDNAPQGPRSLAADGGKVYISYAYGHSVAALDTASLSITGEVAVGRYPEQLAVAGGKLYVTNSGGNDFPNYGETVSVIDIATFTVEKEIKVIINPTQIATDSQGDAYVVSMGNYDDVSATLQRIDAKTGAVSTLGTATNITLVNDKIYAMYAPYGVTSGLQFKMYNALTDAVESENFITDGTTIAAPGKVAVDPLTGKIYITESPYGSTGTIYAFSADGKFEYKFDTEGYDVSAIQFVVQ
jgi:YVTN family beta-propeller protein